MRRLTMPLAGPLWLALMLCWGCGGENGSQGPADAATSGSTTDLGSAGGGVGGKDATGSQSASSPDAAPDPDAAPGDAGSNASDAGGELADAGGAQSQPQQTVCKAPVAATNPGNTCPDQSPAPLEATVVGSGLALPVWVTAPPGENQHIYVLERGMGAGGDGRIVILDRDSGTEVSTFLSLPVASTSSAGSELGLLGLSFHPDYPADPRFFINYTASGDFGTETRISAFEVSAADPFVADADSEVVLLRFDQPQSNHNGGMLAFGPDGCLFVGTGDGGGSGDVGTGHASEGNGQSLDTEHGKILRLDVDAPDGAAPGNLEGAGIAHIWDWGIRNAWRFSFDRETGDLYIGDVGQGEWEEIDVEPAGSGLRNYGWPIMEANHCYNAASCDQAGLTLAVDEYPHGGGDDCVVGGHVYRGSAIPSLGGYYVYGDNGSGRKVRAFVWDGAGRCGDQTLELSDQLTVDGDILSFGEDGLGEIYITTSAGTVYRIEAAP
ncbi:MAG: PQQ-dependent sugar dehydrogenase [Myxococcales bacterium]|nr:PQQ-dependent sugar dehydrogenase [Myxococcales bacterium]